MTETPSYEKPEVFEADLEKVSNEIAKAKENPDMSGLSHEDVVKHSIKQVVDLPLPAPAAEDSLLPAYASDAPNESKAEIERLVQIALKDGLAKANKEAHKVHPFIADAFHDVMRGKLYPELQKRGLI